MRKRSSQHPLSGKEVYIEHFPQGRAVEDFRTVRCDSTGIINDQIYPAKVLQRALHHPGRGFGVAEICA